MKIEIVRSKDTKRVDFTVNGESFHTNDSGLGLWAGEDYAKQIEGTAQFSLTQSTVSGMRKAIERRYKEVSDGE